MKYLLVRSRPKPAILLAHDFHLESGALHRLAIQTTNKLM